MVDKVIREYLDEHKRLVVPEFGAFIRKDSDGRVVFVEFLRKDDDVLSSLLRRTYSLNRAEATALLEQYVETVRSRSGRPGGYVMEGVGVMHRMANGVYDLIYDPQLLPVSEEESVPENKKEPNPEAKKEILTEKPDDTGVPEKEVPHHSPVIPESNVVATVVTEAVHKTPPVIPDQRHRERSESLMPKQRNPATSSQRAGKKPPAYGAPRRRSPIDWVMVIAIIAALLAILAIAYSVLTPDNSHLDRWRRNRSIHAVEEPGIEN